MSTYEERSSGGFVRTLGDVPDEHRVELFKRGLRWLQAQERDICRQCQSGIRPGTHYCPNCGSYDYEKFFDGSSIPADGPPRFVFIAGAVAVGKTTLRRRSYSSGYVVADAAEIFLNICDGPPFEFGVHFESLVETVGRLVVARALEQGRNIVTEIIPDSVDDMRALTDAIRALGYRVEMVGLTADLDVAMKRNLDRSWAEISAYWTTPYQRRWVQEEAERLLLERGLKAKEQGENSGETDPTP